MSDARPSKSRFEIDNPKLVAAVSGARIKKKCLPLSDDLAAYATLYEKQEYERYTERLNHLKFTIKDMLNEIKFLWYKRWAIRSILFVRRNKEREGTPRAIPCNTSVRNAIQPVNVNASGNETPSSAGGDILHSKSEW